VLVGEGTPLRRTTMFPKGTVVTVTNYNNYLIDH
jgi:hypothetical protein